MQYLRVKDDAPTNDGSALRKAASEFLDLLTCQVHKRRADFPDDEPNAGHDWIADRMWIAESKANQSAAAMITTKIEPLPDLIELLRYVERCNAERRRGCLL